MVNLVFFSDVACTTNIAIPADGGWPDSALACPSWGCALCSGWYLPVEKRGCHLALDGNPSTAWRPGSKEQGDFWIGDGWNSTWIEIRFASNSGIACIKASNLGKGEGGGNSWNGGLTVQTSVDDGANYVTRERDEDAASTYSLDANYFPVLSPPSPSPPSPSPSPPPPSSSAYPEGVNAWYCSGAFHIASSTWQDCSGNGKTATLSGSGLAELRSAGHGATSEVLALSGTTSSVISFGAVIQSSFTVCSVTRYTGGAKGRILQGDRVDWLHGHIRGNAGVGYYQGWKTSSQGNVSPNTDWVVMCGTNAGSQLKLVNGVSVGGTSTGGTGRVSLFVNAGTYGNEKSDFAIAELVVWPRGLTDEEMRRASDHLIDRLGMSI